MPVMPVPQCDCWGDENEHCDEVTLKWTDGSQTRVPVRCPGSDVEPYLRLDKIASAGLSYSACIPVRAYVCTLRSWAHGQWLMESGETEEQPDVVLIRGTLQEAVRVWLDESESIAPGSRRLLAAQITGTLETVPPDLEGTHPQALFDGDEFDLDPGLAVAVDGKVIPTALLHELLEAEVTWVTSADTSAWSWQSRLSYWMSDPEGHGEPN